MTDQFENMVQGSMPGSGKLKSYTAGNEQSRWAGVLTQFFESVGIETRRDAETASNIDAVENLSKNPYQFLELLQRVVPQPFTFGQQPAAEANDQFGDLLQEMLPIRDEDRADLKRMIGRNMPEHENETIINNGGQLVQMIQQNFPELNIQLEGIYNLARGVKNIGSSIGRGAKIVASAANDVIQGKMSKKDAASRALKAGIRGAGRMGKAGLRGADFAADKSMGAMNKLGASLAQPGSVTNNPDASGLGFFLPSGSKPVNHTDVSPDESEQPDTGDDQTEIEQPQPERKSNFYDEWKTSEGPGARTIQGLYRLLDKFGVTDFDDYLNLLPSTMKKLDGGFKTKTVIPDTAIIKIRDKLKQEQLSENLIMKRTFNDIVQHAGEQLLEAPEDEMAAADPAMDPAAAEAPPPPPIEEPMADAGPDDMDKLQTDMLELVRRALIINPKDIDQESYMQLTTRVNFDNMQQVKPLLLKLVQNHYPDLDMGDVPKGPGV